MNDTTAIRLIGQPLRRREDFKFLAGKGRYVDDVRLPGMLHMAVLRSPHAHAKIRSVDLSAAKVAPGVRLVLSGKALAGKIGPTVPNWSFPVARYRSVRLSRPIAFALSASAWHSSWRKRWLKPTTPSA